MIKNKNMGTKYTDKGEKVGEEFCPKCQDELVVKMDEGAEVFICENCKFKKLKGKEAGK